MGTVVTKWVNPELTLSVYLLAMSIFSYSVSPKILLINVRAIPQEKLRERQKKSDLEGSF